MNVKIRSGAHAVHDLSIWTQVLLVAGAALLGPAAVFFLSLSIAVVLRMVGPADAPPAIVLVVAQQLGRLVCRRLQPAASPPGAAVEPPRFDIAHSSPGGLTGRAPRSL
jgi:hypothetical protein